MDIALQHRLVGAGVIIALGVILIPIVLDGAGERQLRKMPPEPTIVANSEPGFIDKQSLDRPEKTKTGQIIITLPQDKKTSSAKQSEKVVAVEVPKKSATQQPAKTTPEKVSGGTHSSPVQQKPDTQAPTQTDTNTQKTSSNWVVQVGSFTDENKAVKLRETLRKKKYKAFVEQISGRNGQPLYRVRVGPLPTRKQTEQLAQQLKKSGYKGFITLHP